MKQLLFLLLFPCLALAQYTGNAGQKITLGEQTTADGLVFRGLAADTTRKPSVDTMAYILLDTNTNIIWQYKSAVSNAWTRVGGSISSGVTGTLPVANGGTNNTSYISGAIPFSNGTTLTSDTSKIFFDNSNNRIGFGTSVPLESFHLRRNINDASLMRFDNLNTGDVASARVQVINNQETIGQLATFGSGFGFPIFGIVVANYSVLTTSGTNSNGLLLGSLTQDPVIFGTNGFERMRITSAGEVNIGYGATDNGAYLLQVKDSVYVGGNVSASAYTTRSDYDLKDEIQNISYGLNEVMKMQPVKYTYKSNGSTQLGFIAQDLGVITPEVVSFEDKMSVYYNALIPILTKAIQEQNALIKALEQRLLILENK